MSILLTLACSLAPAPPLQEPATSVTRTSGAYEIRLADGTFIARSERPVENTRVLRVGASGPEQDTVVLWTEVDGNYSEARYSLRLSEDRPFSRARIAGETLFFKLASFDPLRDPVPAAPEALVASGELHIVQFVTQPLESYVTTLEDLGATVRHFLPESAHLVEMNGEIAGQVAELPFVRWVGPYHGAYRVEDVLLQDIAGGQAAPQRVHIQVTERGPEMKDAVADRVAELGAPVVWKIDEGFRFDAELTPAQMAIVAGWDEVLWIDRWGAPEEDMDKVRIDGGADAIEAIGGFTGAGVRAEAMDGNVDASHPDLQSNPVIFHGGNGGSATHGTPVTGIVFGDGAGGAARRGMLPDGQPIFADYGNLNNRYTHTAQLLNSPYNAVFQTNSWGDPRTALYTSVSMEMDDILFNNDIVILQSQSNAGSTQSRPQAWAKNIIGVGGIRHQNTQTLADDSWGGSGSIGPAADGRIKPDLSYWYDSIFTIQAGGGTTQFGGTSAATPMTAGLFGLFYEMWHTGVFGNTPGSTVFESRPKATLARAFMINAASRYSFNGSNADLTRVHQGWGRANVERLLENTAKFYWINETAVLQETDVISYPLTVAAGEPALAVTMVYLDIPATTSSSLHRINDLTLRVTAPNGTTQYWGNNGLTLSNQSTPGGNSNTKDVVENVFIANPTPGIWNVEIFADEINQDSHVETPQLDADFALVVRGVEGLGGQPCVAATTICTGAGNSFSATGARLSGAGTASVSGNNYSLVASSLPPFTAALVLRSETAGSTPLGNGTLCLGGTIFRRGVFSSDFIGGGSYSVDTSTFPAGGMIVSGSTWNFQLWYRDSVGAGNNQSDAIAVTWCE